MGRGGDALEAVVAVVHRLLRVERLFQKVALDSLYTVSESFFQKFHLENNF